VTGSAHSAGRDYRRIAAASGRPSAARARLEVEFRGSPGQQVLTFTHLPALPSGAGVVLCSSIGTERIQNHRRERALATLLGARGWVVERFHYRSAGDSDGESLDLGFTSMVEDAVAAARRLRTERGVEQVAFLGTRLGALVAAAAAREVPASPVVLWEPVVDPATYFEEVFRYKLIQDVMQSRFRSGPARRSLRQEIEEEGFADVLGFPLPRKLYEEALKVRLESELSGTPRPLLVVQISGDSELNGTYSDLEKRLVAGGWKVDTRVYCERIAWWFLARFYRDQQHDEAIVGATADWLQAQLPGS